MNPYPVGVAGPVLSAATVHEAAGRSGALPSAITPIAADMHVRGPAFPVRLPPGDNLWLHRAIPRAQPGDVLVVDCGGGFEYGYFGEVLAEAAIARGLAGLVIHGGVRDSRRLAERGWPVFAERVCLRGTVKDPQGDGTLEEPVVVGDVRIHLGDLVVGDADGVVCVAADRVAGVVAAAAERDAAEAGYLSRLRAGETTLSVYGLS